MAKVTAGTMEVPHVTPAQRMISGGVTAPAQAIENKFSANPYGQTLTRWAGSAADLLKGLNAFDKTLAGGAILIGFGGLVKRFYPELVSYFGEMASVRTMLMARARPVFIFYAADKWLDAHLRDEIAKQLPALFEADHRRREFDRLYPLSEAEFPAIASMN